ncbi:NAD(P)H-dependent oxidoreductase [Roseateles violae]|uniref:NAD(P)H-dependent oxidoreductase n=1 Tax=Roseateles violae TaxID=3058042 RepID=A0ABT8DNW0_9BURK|nr:NAD(P)H-dependent oxidoreductase [Pelomonas sp. PFR6]MDN3919822.1 NAD(P)H-dependent oxidoreductase [Pelomonas sp. PFR6]
MADILIIAAHPDLAQSRVTQALLAAAQKLAPQRLALRDLYRLYPDYAIDVAAEQAALTPARLLVLVHPLQWYSMPGLLKIWLDEVLRFGWAYGPGGQALQGKDLWLATSTGGSAESYAETGHNRHTLDTFLLPYAQSARLCGLRFLPPWVLHGAHRVSDAEIEQHARGFAERLLSYPGWCAGLPGEPPPEIPLDARPALFSPIGGTS